jgi:chromate reductase, NAD(P)H dehydrogenase (quinone)
MYTIVAGTNRKGSNTLKVAQQYQQLLAAKGLETTLLSLENIDLQHRDAAFEALEQQILIPTQTFLFIVPEYNGSFPGALKMLIDTGKSHMIWWHKRALITGVSTGRAGNLRGMEHLAGVLNYLKITVYPGMLPISVVDKLMDTNGKITDAGTLQAIDAQLEGFLKWEGVAKVKSEAVV